MIVCVLLSSRAAAFQVNELENKHFPHRRRRKNYSRPNYANPSISHYVASDSFVREKKFLPRTKNYHMHISK